MRNQEGVGVEAGLAVGRAQAQVLGRHVEAVGHGLGDAARLQVAAVAVPVGEEAASQGRAVSHPVGGPDHAVVADLDAEARLATASAYGRRPISPPRVAEHRLQHAEGEGPQGAGPLPVAAERAARIPKPSPSKRRSSSSAVLLGEVVASGSGADRSR